MDISIYKSLLVNIVLTIALLLLINLISSNSIREFLNYVISSIFNTTFDVFAIELLIFKFLNNVNTFACCNMCI